MHHLRFRANLYVDDLPAFAEFDLVGATLAVDGSDVRLEVAARIDRCAATAVNPETAARDLNVPAALRRHFGHTDCGVYLEVTTGGRLAVGQGVRPLS